MLVHVIYAHPTPESFTHELLKAFVDGLAEAGHEHTISDLYEMGFNPVMSSAEHRRESAQNAQVAVPDDVAAEQAKLDAADAWVFIYPVWWVDCPAILKGWFDRVWTVGWAYKPQTLAKAKTAMVLCAAGNTVEALQESGRYQAMKTVMLSDRIFDRATTKSFHVLGGIEAAEEKDRPALAAQQIQLAKNLGRDFA